jgi:hypothetical protein
MTDYASEPVGWYVWITELSLIPQEYQYIIRVISSFFITLALAPILPVVVLVFVDLILWFWRLAVASWRAGVAPDIQAAGLPRPPITGTVLAGALEPEAEPPQTNRAPAA